MIISSIDIGTNTVLLLIAQTDTKNKKILSLLNEYRVPRIGKNVASSGIISEDSIKKLEAILLEFQNISSRYKSEKILAVGTAVFRNADNCDEVIELISLSTGIDIRVVPGEEESHLAYLGITEGASDSKKRLVVDIGGGSTEITSGTGSQIIFSKSIPVGVVNSSERYSSSRNFEQDLHNFYNEKFEALASLDLVVDEAFAIAGTPTTIASIKLRQYKFIPEEIEGTTLNLQDIEDFIRNYSYEKSFYLRKYATVLQGREDLIIPGSIILKTVMEKLSLEEIKVSTRGIRHGVIIQWLQNQGFVF